ncbi:MAG: hypothetical protein QXZ11_01230 [Thermoproteota archaeon]
MRKLFISSQIVVFFNVWGNIPIPEHSSPDFVRSRWIDLDGRCGVAFNNNGIGERKNGTDKWYDGRILLHIGAVDYLSRVWVNGEFMGRHIGGILPV